MFSSPLLSKPAGPSQGHWNDMGSGFCGEDENDWEVCEICGTKHMAPASNESFLRMRLLGLEGFEHCCGRLLDVIYQESGDRFVEAFLMEFAENPADPRFDFFRRLLQQRLGEATERLKETSSDLAEAQNLAKIASGDDSGA